MNRIRFLLVQWASRGYVAAMSLLLSVLLARILGPSLYGEYATALAIGSLALVFLDGGFNAALHREKIKPTYNQFFDRDQFVGTSITYSVLIAILLSFLAALLGGNHAVLGFSIIICFFMINLSQLISSELIGEGRYEKEAIWQITSRTVTFMAVLIAVYVDGRSLALIFLSWCVGTYAAYLIVKPVGIFRFNFDYRYVRGNRLLFLFGVSTLVYFRIDIVLMRYFHIDNHQIGLYATAHRVIEYILWILAPIALLIVRHARENQEESKINRRSLRRIVIAFIFLSILFFVLISSQSEVIVLVLFGGMYSESAYLLHLLSYSLPFMILNLGLMQIALAWNLDFHLFIYSLTAAIIVVVLNIFFIREFGVFASIYIKILVELMLFVVLLTLIFRVKRDPSGVSNGT